MMRVGFTYDLRSDYLPLGYSEDQTAEFDSEETIHAIEDALVELGFQVDRIGNLRNLARRLVNGERWDLVFNIAEGISGRCRESQVPALLDAYGVPYVFSDALTMAATLDKAFAKRIVAAAGVPTAPFALISAESPTAPLSVPPPLFLKPVAEGTGKGCFASSLVDSADEAFPLAVELSKRYGQPTLVESYLPGREFTVGIVGNGSSACVIAVLEVIFMRAGDVAIYSLEAKENWKETVRYEIVTDEEARKAGAYALAAYHALECRDAARIDMRSDAVGEPHFMEANALPGLRPDYSDLSILARDAGVPFVRLIDQIVSAAIDRHGLEHLRALVPAAQ